MILTRFDEGVRLANIKTTLKELDLCHYSNDKSFTINTLNYLSTLRCNGLIDVLTKPHKKRNLRYYKINQKGIERLAFLQLEYRIDSNLLQIWHGSW